MNIIPDFCFFARYPEYDFESFLMAFFCKFEWLADWMDGQTDNGQTDGWMDKQIHELVKNEMGA